MEILLRLGISCLLAVCFSASLNATIIYDIGTDGANTGDNGQANSDTSLVDNMDGTFTLVTGIGSGANTNSFVNSTDTINNLLGTPLTSSDVVTVSGTIDAISGNLSANGTEFGLSSLLVDFRGQPNLLLRIRPDNNNANLTDAELANGFNDTDGNGTATGQVNNVGLGATEPSLINGFSYTVVYDVNGITYTLDDIVDRGNSALTSQTIFLSAADILTDSGFVYDFENTVGNSFSYYNFQTSGTGERTATISEFTIDVTSAVPEPSSAALISLCAAGFFMRRRR